ncbi:MAG: TrkA family potassium uptake protein [Caldilineaceae bacterium]|nr:TrkA family potassium uptake protein [Caldilineaceae bacterium]
MRFIVVGCGRAGSRLVELLSVHGHQVTVVDVNADALRAVALRDNVATVQGVGIDRAVLEEAGIRQADGLAAVSGDDETNVIVARMARQVFHVPRVVARVYDPRKADIYRRLGLLTVSPLVWGVDRMVEALLSSSVYPLLSLGSGEVHIVQVQAAPPLVGRTVQAISVAGEIHVTAIQRDGHTFLPGPDAIFRRGDLVFLAVVDRAMDKLEMILAYV